MFYSKTTGGFYSQEIHGSARPDDCVEITAERHAELISAQSAGKRIVADADGYPNAIDPPPLSLNQVQAVALAAIDAEAGVARARYITVAPGQEATYILKAQQAAAFKAGGYAGAVPGLVQAEVDATGATAQQAADAILVQEAAWAVKA
ncbi:MAG: hypothetical protein K8F32_12320, partial [Rhodocyclaceae bacterium]|nr:hypothetical protein [Rhodocyclaceae bacterium]